METYLLSDEDKRLTPKGQKQVLEAKVLWNDAYNAWESAQNEEEKGKAQQQMEQAHFMAEEARATDEAYRFETDDSGKFVRELDVPQQTQWGAGALLQKRCWTFIRKR